MIAQWESMIPMRRMAETPGTGRRGDLSASDASSYTTGSDIIVDGG